MATKKKTKKKNKKQQLEFNLMIYVYCLCIIALCIFGITKMGLLGYGVSFVIRYLIGNLEQVFYGVCIVVSLLLMWKKQWIMIPLKYLIAIALILIGWLLLCALPTDANIKGFAILSDFIANSGNMINATSSPLGGIVGAILASFTTFLLDHSGTKILVAIMMLISALFLLSGAPMLFIRSKVDDTLQQAKTINDKYQEERKKKIAKRATEKQIDALIEELDEGNKQLPIEINKTKPQEEKVKEKKTPFGIEIKPSEVKEEKTQEKIVVGVDSKKTPSKKQQEAITIIEKTIGKEDTFVSQYAFDFDNYELPSITLLKDNSKNNKNTTNQKSAADRGKRLIELLNEFGVKATLVAINIGPTVTRFEIKPDLGVRVNKISSLQQDIKMALAASEIRIEAPIPGKSAVGIEIPNAEKNTVSMSEMLINIPDKYNKQTLTFALGKDLSGECIYGVLNKMPHLLVAGATGSGKSVCINSIIISLLMRTRPDQVKLLLIDPKKVEFTPYREIPHLIAPVITDAEQANRSLKVVVKMMDKRYDQFAKLGVKNIEGYQEYLQAHQEEELEPMPWLIVIIDELADLMLEASKDVEASIQRITQLARAAGIHLIVATQRPSVDVITGVIKSNITSRIAFQVSSNIDSRTIIDQQGAERLLGYGDMLYVSRDSNVPVRVQGVFVSDEEVQRICMEVSKMAKPKFDDRFLTLEASDIEEDDDDDMIIADPIYDDVKAFVIQTRKASTSLIQRKFSVGYARAARLIDLLEQQGIVSESRGSKPREVLVQYEDPLADE